MPRKREITKVESFLSIRILVRTVYDECATDEDAITFIEAGLVKINGVEVRDPYYGVNGNFTVQVANRPYKRKYYQTSEGKYMTSKLLVFANKKKNLDKLRAGEVLVYLQKDMRIYYEGVYHLSLSPPDFSGDVLIACYSGKIRTSKHFAVITPGQAITECGARVK